MPTKSRAAPAPRRGIPHKRQQIVEIQRARILEAMTEIVAERGLYGTTIAAVAERASVSRMTFGEIFGGIEQAFVALVQQVTARPTRLVREAFEAESSWSESVLAGLQALVIFLDSEPALARVCLIDALAGPPEALEHRALVLRPLAALVEQGQGEVPSDRLQPAVTGDAMVASVAGTLHARLVSGQAPPFVGLIGELAALIVAPYLGPEEACKVAEAGERRSKAIIKERSGRSPEIRAPVPKELHHARANRARACVLYVAENPGASNRKIATGIGITHVGQASTLLSRLEKLEVLEKRAGGAGRPNAWTLSPHGEEVVRSLKRP